MANLLWPFNSPWTTDSSSLNFSRPQGGPSYALSTPSQSLLSPQKPPAWMPSPAMCPASGEVPFWGAQPQFQAMLKDSLAVVKLTKEDLRKLSKSSGPSEAVMAGLVDNCDGILRQAGISTVPLRLCHFLAQVAVETQHLTRLTENLNYSADGLLATFPSSIADADAAEKLAGDPKAIANAVYGAKNGNKGGDDGWNFRGRGYLQTTGRENYRKAGKTYEDKPEMLEDPKSALDAAVAYWTSHDCNALADKDDVKGITRAVNGKAMLHLKERTEYLGRAKNIWIARPKQ